MVVLLYRTRCVISLLRGHLANKQQQQKKPTSLKKKQVLNEASSSYVSRTGAGVHCDSNVLKLEKVKIQ